MSTGTAFLEGVGKTRAPPEAGRWPRSLPVPALLLGLLFSVGWVFFMIGLRRSTPARSAQVSEVGRPVASTESAWQFADVITVKAVRRFLARWRPPQMRGACALRKGADLLTENEDGINSQHASSPGIPSTSYSPEWGHRRCSYRLAGSRQNGADFDEVERVVSERPIGGAESAGLVVAVVQPYSGE